MNSLTSLLFLCFFSIHSFAAVFPSREIVSSGDLGQRWQNSTDITSLWGPYSPFFNVPSEMSSDVPEQCRLTFVQVLSRHGARDPTAGKTAQYAQLIAKIKANVKNFTGDFAFLANYTYTLGADQLTLFGQQEMVTSGITFYKRYQNLTRDFTPFFRSSGEARVVESAENFTQGFHQAKEADSSASCDDNYPYPILVISEALGVNNTLSHSLCTAFENSTALNSIAPAAEKKFLSTFAPPVTARLNAALPGANLSNTDTLSLMDLCPFNTVAEYTLPTLSPFCALFTTSEWLNYDYLQTLLKFYGFGAGNPLGPTQGVGFTNEFMARLTHTPVQDHTSTNSTLDSSNATFPLGETLYADFSHENDMTSIFFALGLYNSTGLLSTSARETTEQTKGYSASWTVPFAARAYFEKMVCGEDGSEAREEVVRVIVNDRVLPLANFGADAKGLVPLSQFVSALSFAKSDGDWEECFV